MLFFFKKKESRKKINKRKKKRKKKQKLTITGLPSVGKFAALTGRRARIPIGIKFQATWTGDTIS